MAQKKIDRALLARGVELVRAGTHGTASEVAAILGIGAATLYRALGVSEPGKVPRRGKGAPARVAGAAVPIDAEGDPLDVLRALLADATATLAKLPPDSPRLSQTRESCRALVKGIAAIEEKRGAAESPDERVARLRRDDGQTRQEIEQYIAQYEREAMEPKPGAPHGSCIHCSAPLTPEQAAEFRASRPAHQDSRPHVPERL
jgi:hypothetical protein